MARNSFSLFETILSLMILSVLVSGFLPLAHLKKSHSPSLHEIKNTLILKHPHDKISAFSFSYSLKNSNIALLAGNGITRYVYIDEPLELEYFFMPVSFKALSFKEFQ